MSPNEGYVHELVETAAAIQLVEPEAVWSDTRAQRLVDARHAIWLVLRNRGWTYPDIAARFERHHGTVHYGVARARQRNDAEFSYMMRHLESVSYEADDPPEDWLRGHIAAIDEAITRATEAREQLAGVLDAVLRARRAATRPVVTRMRAG